MYSFNNRLVTRLASTLKSNSIHTTRTTLRSMINHNGCALFHVDIKNNHFVMTEEKRVFLEALKVELFSSRSSVVNLMKEGSQRSYSQSNGSRAVSTVADDHFDTSLEVSRNLMCHKRHDVLTQQKSEYFLYL